MPIEQIQVVKCDKCKRIQELETAEYVVVKGEVTIIRPKDTSRRPGFSTNQKTVLIPPEEMSNKTSGPDGIVTCTLCTGCFYSIARGATGDD